MRIVEVNEMELKEATLGKRGLMLEQLAGGQTKAYKACCDDEDEAVKLCDAYMGLRRTGGLQVAIKRVGNDVYVSPAAYTAKRRERKPLAAVAE